jgi:hypothetical protein
MGQVPAVRGHNARPVARASNGIGDNPRFARIGVAMRMSSCVLADAFASASNDRGNASRSRPIGR